MPIVRYATWLTCACLVFRFLGAISPAEAQQAADEKGRIPVLVVQLQEPSPAFVGPTILRRFAGRSLDCLVIPSGTTSGQVASALLTLLAARAVSGDTAIRSETIRATTSRSTYPLGASEDGRIERILARLQSQELSTIPGIGRVRVLPIHLPPAKRALAWIPAVH